MNMVKEVSEVHISSVVVHCLPDKLEQVLTSIKHLNQIEVHAPDPKGKFILLLETSNEQEILAAIDRIQGFNGVLTATMVYHEIDDGTEEGYVNENNA